MKIKSISTNSWRTMISKDTLLKRRTGMIKIKPLLRKRIPSMKRSNSHQKLRRKPNSPLKPRRRLKPQKRLPNLNPRSLRK